MLWDSKKKIIREKKYFSKEFVPWDSKKIIREINKNISLRGFALGFEKKILRKIKKSLGSLCSGIRKKIIGEIKKIFL